MAFSTASAVSRSSARTWMRHVFTEPRSRVPWAEMKCCRLGFCPNIAQGATFFILLTTATHHPRLKTEATLRTLFLLLWPLLSKSKALPTMLAPRQRKENQAEEGAWKKSLYPAVNPQLGIPFSPRNWVRLGKSYISTPDARSCACTKINQTGFLH